MGDGKPAEVRREIYKQMQGGKSVWESGRQSPAQRRGSGRDKGKQAAGEEKKARNRRTDREKERETKTGRRIDT